MTKLIIIFICLNLTACGWDQKKCVDGKLYHKPYGNGPYLLENGITCLPEDKETK